MIDEGHASIAEYLSNDILDEDFLNSFALIWRLQLVLGSCRVDARNQFISAPTITHKIYTIAILMFISVGYYQILHYSERAYPDDVVTMVDLTGVIVMSILVTLELFGLIYLCYHAELFHLEVSRVKVSSIELMSVYQSGPLRDKAKSIFELIENIPPIFSVYGMFEIRAYTFISLLSVITWLLVTVLQFEFL
ncbi:uncharacterized protein LOC128676523 [Plodia interpunctella]|uniref:uncharacterized protein LOC128676523 n=1 Tax=Plodia interpunctella TaxID=58824 RepID=UPI002367DE06|nr:uncharacterized protein LOC128676523 [Plodia interpunctella]